MIAFIVLDIDFDSFRPFGYIDCTHLETARPGAGPIEVGEGSRRRQGACLIHRAFCNTYVKKHGLKFQSLMLPNGMWASAYGSSVRHNDLGMLNLSALPDQLLQYFVENNVALGGDNSFPSMYGDSIYHNTLVVTRKIANAAEGSLEELLNKRMNCGREAVEHGYGQMGEHFKLFEKKRKFQLF